MQVEWISLTFDFTGLRGFVREVQCIAGLGVGSVQTVTEPTLSARLCLMNAHVDHILDEALGLPADERSALTVALLDSLEGSDDSSITEAWRREIKARQAALRAGASPTERCAAFGRHAHAGIRAGRCGIGRA